MPPQQRRRIEISKPEHPHERAAVASAGGAKAQMLVTGVIVEDRSRPGVFYVEEPNADEKAAS